MSHPRKNFRRRLLLLAVSRQERRQRLQNPLAGDAVGRNAVFAQFGRYRQGTDGTLRAELKHVLAGDEGRVVAMHHNSGTRAGKRLDVDACIVFESKDGRFLDGREYVFDLHAWDEFWS